MDVSFQWGAMCFSTWLKIKLRNCLWKWLLVSVGIRAIISTPRITLVGLRFWTHVYTAVLMYFGAHSQQQGTGGFKITLHLSSVSGSDSSWAMYTQEHWCQPLETISWHFMHESGIGPVWVLLQGEDQRQMTEEEFPIFAKVICDFCQTPLPLICAR